MAFWLHLLPYCKNIRFPSAHWICGSVMSNPSVHKKIPVSFLHTVLEMCGIFYVPSLKCQDWLWPEVDVTFRKGILPRFCLRSISIWAWLNKRTKHHTALQCKMFPQASRQAVIQEICRTTPVGAKAHFRHLNKIFSIHLVILWLLPLFTETDSNYIFFPAKQC